MAAVQAGGDRQDLHERIRVHSHEAASRMKTEDGVNDLLDRIRGDDAFAAIKDSIDSLLDPTGFVGRAPQQVEEYLKEVIGPLLEERADVSAPEGEIRI